MKYTLDTVMNFGLIQEADWSWIKQEGIDLTPRMMFDISEWNISFELGSFWRLNNDVQEWCDGKLNDTWFYDEMVMILFGICVIVVMTDVKYNATHNNHFYMKRIMALFDSHRL